MTKFPKGAARLAATAMAAFFLLMASPFARAQDAALVVHLLDYIAVDYSAAVVDGKVASRDEYAEMTEFGANVEAGLAKLPDSPERARLITGSQMLRKLIADKAPPPAVAKVAGDLRRDVVSIYRVAVGPRKAPDLSNATVLYAAQCANCHGATGLGDGPLAKGMEPAPANFHETERSHVRSVHGLYNTLTLGVAGTPMRAFTEIPDEDRWALAYLTSNWGASAEEMARGRKLWEAGAMRTQFPGQAAIAGRSYQDVVQSAGADGAAVLTYLRANPALLEQGKPDSWKVARDRLAESVEHYRKGNADAAVTAALSSYLDGFELTESSLRLVDEDLMRKIESAMIAYRNALKDMAPIDRIEAMARDLDAAIVQAQEKVSGGGLSEEATFLAAFIILLREGLEAVLVVVALAAFLRRSGQIQALPYLHFGWIAALLLGGVTWFVATRVIAASGASREMTEGISALVASAMLLYVGFWLHDKSHAQAWQGFLLRGTRSLGTGAAWGLAFMAFLAVYREVFETVLFYETLWAQAPDQSRAIGAGFVAALVTLGAVTWAMLKFSVKLPLGVFFGASGILLAILAVVLAGNGISALQEAGVFPVTQVSFVTVSWLGIHPNVQGLGVQAVLSLIIVGLLLLRRR